MDIIIVILGHNLNLDLVGHQFARPRTNFPPYIISPSDFVSSEFAEVIIMFYNVRLRVRSKRPTKVRVMVSNNLSMM